MNENKTGCVTAAPLVLTTVLYEYLLLTGTCCQYISYLLMLYTVEYAIFVGIRKAPYNWKWQAKNDLTLAANLKGFISYH